MPAPKRIEPTNLNEWFGRKIRDLRDARGWTQVQLGEEVRLSGSRIAQFERAEDVPPQDITELLDEALGANGLLVEIRPFLSRTPYQKWADEFVGFEAKAIRIQQYTYVVPGLLQTREYATALLAAGIPFFGGDLDEKVDLRMARQSVLDGPNHPWLRCVMDESAILRAVCPPDVMHDQLEHLLKECERPRVRVQVLPFSRNRMVLTGIGLATLWTFADGQTVVYKEGVNAGGVFVTDPREVSLFASVYDQLQSDALDTDASKAFIRKVLEENYS
ncbi:Scr1 family TA system antitoxin-like transcriptional regulator [Streptomyces sp. NPDC021100]|uniref:helix-turn-helix domain-containing protein n=1 Tax=Streptomyces sp. NPDC021100 TaxID=3365114 RepID=UPI0037BD9C2E